MAVVVVDLAGVECYWWRVRGVPENALVRQGLDGEKDQDQCD